MRHRWLVGALLALLVATGDAFVVRSLPPRAPSRHRVGRIAAEITRIPDTDAYHALVADATERNQLTVIKFYASWCRACKAMAPKFERVAEDWPDIEFHEILFDDNKVPSLASTALTVVLLVDRLSSSRAAEAV
jgi:thiol-disulfide isomerase/thioredoxin